MSTELIIVAGVVFVLFGGAALPRFARGLGQAKKEFEQTQGDEGKGSTSIEAKKNDADKGE